MSNLIENQKIIEMKSIKKMYPLGDQGFWALKGIDFVVSAGEFIAIVGKSGSGKSTMLNVLAGIDMPTEGDIIVNGKNLKTLSENELSKFRGENIGFVFQFFQLMPTLTVLENVIMPMDFIEKSPQIEKRRKAEILLKKVGMLSHSDKYPATLSGGEQQRVAIARSLANNPDIIFADEPTGNLDTKTTEDIFLLLTHLKDGGKTIIMVTHNDELALRSSRIVRLKDGNIIEDFLTHKGARL